MTGRGSRNKGAGGELEVQQLAREHGFKFARRNFASGGRGGGDLTGIAGVHMEIKRTEKCAPWAWIEQCTRDCADHDLPIVAFRRNRSEWQAIVPLDELLALLALKARA